jgi:hypothetical protein
MRSFLTILGIVIGVSAVITMVTLGNGATKSVSDQISALGSNLLIVMPGQRFGASEGRANPPAFKMADVEAIRTQIGSVKAVAPTASESAIVVAGAKNWSTSITVQPTNTSLPAIGEPRLNGPRPVACMNQALRPSTRHCDSPPFTSVCERARVHESLRALPVCPSSC